MLARPKGGSRSGPKPAVVLMLGLALLLAAVIPAIADGVANDPVVDAIDELDAKYASLEAELPDGPERGPLLSDLNWRYEEEFAAIASAESELKGT